jgi:hypothetical protein
MNRQTTLHVGLGPIALSLLVAAGLGVSATPQSSDLADLLRRAGATVTQYAQESAVILAEESCQQQAFTESTDRTNAAMSVAGGAGTVSSVRRNWKSELALVQLPELGRSGHPWMEIRDVIEVDGKPLPDRKERLERLIRTDPNWRTSKARDIVEEGARFNIGPVRRTINTPSVPLLMLHPANQSRFTFSASGNDSIKGVAATKVSFLEARRPTLIRASEDGGDAPSSGTFWIHPATGEVLRADLQCGVNAPNRLTVAYQRHETFGLRLPSEMVEKATTEDGHAWVNGKCTYSNFRRFEVRAQIRFDK